MSLDTYTSKLAIVYCQIEALLFSITILESIAAATPQHCTLPPAIGLKDLVRIEVCQTSPRGTVYSSLRLLNRVCQITQRLCFLGAAKYYFQRLSDRHKDELSGVNWIGTPKTGDSRSRDIRFIVGRLA